MVEKNFLNEKTCGGRPFLYIMLYVTLFFLYKKQVQHEKINCKKISDTDINVRTNCYQKITSFLIFYKYMYTKSAIVSTVEIFLLIYFCHR